MPMPEEIVGLNRETVRFVWSDEAEDSWPARELRLACNCAHCRSEATGERLVKDGDVPETVLVTDISFVGNYGVNIHFSDGHSTGIYRFSELRRGSSVPG